MKNFKILSALLLGFMLSSIFCYSEGLNYKIVSKIELSNDAKWDYLTVDKNMHRLYVSNGTKVHVVDLLTNKPVGVIENLSGVHGIAIASDFNKGFISNGGNNTVTVFDIITLKVTETIKLTSKKPDAIVYEPLTKRIFTFNGSKDATAIDAKTNKIEGTLTLEGSPEFSCSDGKGKMFVNIEDKNEVVCFDPKELKVIDKWSLAPCETPTGMAIDAINKRIFIGGRNKLMAVMDYTTGKVITTQPIGAGVDACVYDKESKSVFCSNKEGTITVIKQESADKYSVVDNIKTMEGAKTMAMDKSTHIIYTSTVINTIKDEKGEAKKVFGVLVLDNK